MATFKSNDFDQSIIIVTPVASGNRINDILSKHLQGSCLHIKRLAAEWINSYNLNQSEALRSMLELILHTTGVKHVLKKENVLKLHHLNSETFDSWMRDPSINPLIWNELYLVNLSKFINLILTEKVLMNKQFMEQIHNLLLVMNKSKWRTGRYSAVMIGSAITLLYSQLWTEIDSMVKNTSSNLNIQNLKENLIEVENLFNCFVTLTILRLRDIELGIRKFAFQTFYDWCKYYPQLFVKDIYLRNIYWAFYDSSTTIRVMALKACCFLISSGKFVGSLDAFIAKTLPALIIRTHDKNHTVAVAAVKSAVAIHRKLPDLFKYANVEKIYMLVYSNNRTVASLAALFIYQVMRYQSAHPIIIIKELITFLHESEVLFCRKWDIVLLKNIFQYAEKELTDWQAWINLLLRCIIHEHKDVQEVACRFLLHIISYSLHSKRMQPKKFPCFPVNNDNKVLFLSAKKEKIKKQYEKCQKQITSHFGPYLIQLWNNYRNERCCLSYLITIPQYFCSDIENLDMKQICTYLLAMEINDPKTLQENICTLAFFHHAMSLSHKWKRSIFCLENCLFGSIVKVFLKVCERLAKNEQQEVENIILVRMYYIVKYFDLTQTKMLQDALTAFRYLKDKQNPKIIFYTAHICLYIVEWQLNNLLKEDYSEDELKFRLYKLKSQTQTIILQMEDLVYCTNSVIREMVSSVLCRLITLFSSKNRYIKDYPVIHISRPQLLISEWFIYQVYTMGPWEEIPLDEYRFFVTTKVLKRFCSLLTTGVVPITYVSNILPYFRLYKKENNYNALLENAVKKLIPSNSFPYELIKALAAFHVTDGYDIEGMVNGLCSIALIKLKPAILLHTVALSIICTGLVHITKYGNHSFFRGLTPFLRLLSKEDSAKVKKYTLDTFYWYIYDPFVKHFIDAIED